MGNFTMANRHRSSTLYAAAVRWTGDALSNIGLSSSNQPLSKERFRLGPEDSGQSELDDLVFVFTLGYGTSNAYPHDADNRLTAYGLSLR